LRRVKGQIRVWILFPLEYGEPDHADGETRRALKVGDIDLRDAAGGSDGGLVILSRSGRIVKRLPARGLAGPALGAPVWSGSGRALAYLSVLSGGTPALTVWSGGGRILIHPLPSSAGRYGTCVWSPDGRSVLCPAAGGSEWVVVPAAGGPPAVARGSGSPVAWLP